MGMGPALQETAEAKVLHVVVVACVEVVKTDFLEVAGRDEMAFGTEEDLVGVSQEDLLETLLMALV